MTPKAFRSIRLALGLSISEFAQRIGLAEPDIDAMETGRKPINISELNPHLERLAPGDTRDHD